MFARCLNKDFKEEKGVREIGVSREPFFKLLPFPALSDAREKGQARGCVAHPVPFPPGNSETLGHVQKILSEGYECFLKGNSSFGRKEFLEKIKKKTGDEHAFRDILP